MAGLISGQYIYFNSQPHEEADGQDAENNLRGYWISTHSLTKRLTFSQEIPVGKKEHFNSQPHEEADAHLLV